MSWHASAERWRVPDAGMELIVDEHATIYEHIVWQWTDSQGNKRLSLEIRLASGQDLSPGQVTVTVLSQTQVQQGGSEPL
jgi:hypothetical protein